MSAKRNQASDRARKDFALSSLVESFRKATKTTASVDTIIRSWRIWSTHASVVPKTIEAYWKALCDAGLNQQEGTLGPLFQEWISAYPEPDEYQTDRNKDHNQQSGFGHGG